MVRKFSPIYGSINKACDNKESFNQKKSEQYQCHNLIVDIAVNRCLFRTIELKIVLF